MNGKRNRTAGSNFERACVKLFKDAGFTDCVTSRSSNRNRDAQKIDLVNRDEIAHGRLPWSVQCKNMKGHIPYGKILSEMPKEQRIVKVILHNQTEKVNNRFVTRGQFAILEMSDFMAIVKKLKDYESAAAGNMV